MSTVRKKIYVDGINEFHLVGTSSGGMGKVYFLDPAEQIDVHHTPMGRIVHPFSGSIAAKFPKRLSDSETFERECKIWLDLRHRHIVPLLRLIQIGGQMAAIMPLYFQNVADLIRERDSLGCPFWAEQLIGICDGLNYAWNERGLLHLDLKPQNLLNYYEDRDPLISIADWGMARFQDQCYARSKAVNAEEDRIASLQVYGGTLPYMSPERILGALRGDNYVHQVTDDIFSLGVIMVEIAVGKNPCIQGCSFQQDIVNNILTGEYHLSLGGMLNEVPSPLLKLAHECCHPDKSRRPQNYRKIIKRLKKHVV